MEQDGKEEANFGVSRVSSVLNRNTRQFGKKHLFDQDEETCWNSDQVRHLPGPFIPHVNHIQGSRVPGELQGTSAEQYGSCAESYPIN